mgnify:FL=1
MKKIILILITILTSTIITSQVRFNYIKWNKEYAQEDSTGLIYYTSDPDTTLVKAKGFKASIIYNFDNEGETVRFIPVYKTKVKKEEVIYLGKWENKLYKITYNKVYGDFIIKKRALLPNYKTIMYFHRDYDYYDQLTGE